MYDLDALHRKCRRYHFKRILPWLLGGVFVMITAAVGTYFVTLQHVRPLPQKELESDNKPKISQQTKNTQTAQQQKAVSATQQKQDKYSPLDLPDAKCYVLQFASAKKEYVDYLKPMKKKLEDLGFSCFFYYKKYAMLRCDRTSDKKHFLASVQKAKNNGLEYLIITKEQCTQTAKPTTGLLHKASHTALPSPVLDADTPTEPKQSQNSVDITIKPSSVAELKTIFQRRPSYSIALATAKKYFAQGNYEESLKWAKKANKLDQKKEEAWELYARSLYRMGDKESAMKILKFYLRFQNSPKIEELLHQWENEK